MYFNNCLTETEEISRLADLTVEALRAALNKTEEEGRNKHGIWMDDKGMILCKTETQADGIADFLEDLGFDYVRTGYYDPAQDEKEGCVDEYTGFYYVDWD